MSRNFSLDSISQTIFNGLRNNNLQYENRIIISANTTFVVPPNTKALKFSAVGGGRSGAATASGAGAGYFEKTFYAPFTGLTTSFQLTVGAANGGNTILANSAGTTIATAFGATVSAGGTASGGDLNANGSPGGTNPGVGGASGGCFGDAQYNSTFAGRWVYLAESFTNDNVKNFMLSNYFTNGGAVFTALNPSGLAVGTVDVAPSVLGAPGGLFAPGASGSSPTSIPGGQGGFGGRGGNGGSAFPGSSTSGGNGGIGGAGGDGGAAPSSGSPGGNGGFGAPGGSATFVASGGNGGFGGAGGVGGPSPFGGAGQGGNGGFGGGGGRGGASSPTVGGRGGDGGFGGGGGAGGPGSPPGPAGNGGAGAFIVEWTTTLPNKTGV